MCQNTGDEPEVENGEYLTLGEGEHHDASKLSQCDPAGKYPMMKSPFRELRIPRIPEHGAAHVGEHVGRPLDPISTDVHAERPRHVAAELNADSHLRTHYYIEDVSTDCATDRHDEVDKGDGVQGDLPPVHQAAEVEDDQDDHQQVDARGDQVEAHQDKGDDENGGEGDS